MSNLTKLESNLEEVFVKKAPPMPANVKKVIVQYLPWVNLVLGVVTLWAAWVLWNWARVTNSLADYANTLSRLYGGEEVVASRLTIGIWIGLTVLVVEALLYLLAFPGTRDRKKSGWNLLFYAVLVNAIYSVVVAFTSYGGLGTLLGGLVGTAIGLYILFQIRSAYSG